MGIYRQSQPQVKGHVPELAASHTASRVLQACLKYGTPEDRALIQAELLPHLLDLSKSSYGHFLVTKLISTAAKKALPGVRGGSQNKL